MPFCIKCGRKLKPSANFCHYCGAQVVPHKGRRLSARRVTIRRAGKWYVFQNNRRYGPYSEKHMRLFIGKGWLKEDALVWCEGMRGWARAADVEPFKLYFQRSEALTKKSAPHVGPTTEQLSKERFAKPSTANKTRIITFSIGLVVAIIAISGICLWLLPQLTRGGGGYAPPWNPIESELQKVPRGYYSTDMFPNYAGTFSDLTRFLTSGFKLPSNYQRGVFDCSESAAYVEWALEDAGFDAVIAVSSYCPWGSGGHAWVIVYTKDGYTVPIETTALTGYGLWDEIERFFTGRVKGIVYSNDLYADYYYHPEHTFSDIYETIRYTGSASEWDWWLGCWGFV